MSNVYTTEQARACNNAHVQAITNSQNMTELSDISGSLPSSLSLNGTEETIGANSTALILPDPPTHEPGERSRNRGRVKGFYKLKEMFSSKK